MGDLDMQLVSTTTTTTTIYLLHLACLASSSRSPFEALAGGGDDDTITQAIKTPVGRSVALSRVGRSLVVPREVSIM